MPARFQLLIFDLDGTLIDSSLDLAHAMNAAMRHFGFPEHDVESVRSFVGDGAAKLVERGLPEGEKHRVEEGRQVFLKYYEEHLLDFTRPYDGVTEMLDALVGIPKAIATNKPEYLSRKIVDGLGWNDTFLHLIGGDTLPERKPDASVVRTICDRVGISPAGTLMIGDGPQDVGAGKNAGAFTCGVSWGFRGAEILHGTAPTFLIDHPLELVQLL